MRLWTFQPKKCADTLLNGNTWYSKDFSIHNRIKEIDKQYIRNEGTPEQVNPIYCFSKVFDCDALSLKILIQAFSYLSQYYKFSLYSGQRVMLELEVPEENFLNMKTVYPPEDSEHYELITSYYRMRNRKSREDTEVVLPEIRYEWVVAVRYFEDKDSYVQCKTEVVNAHLFPTWTTTFGTSGDGYPIIREDGKLKKLSFYEMADWVRNNGMHGVPKYFTIEECLQVCDTVTQQVLFVNLNVEGLHKRHTTY